MYRDYKIVAVIPSGRRRYMELLIKQLLGYREILDECRLWVNTNDKLDLEYLLDVRDKNSSFITLEFMKNISHKGENLAIHQFFRNCCDNKTIYVRFDDDLVLLDTLDAFKKFLDFRIDNPQYLLISANVLNNSIVTYLQQHFGNIPVLDKGYVEMDCLDKIGWESPNFAYYLHNFILDKLNNGNTLNYFHFNKAFILWKAERFSINCVSWFGEEWAKFGGNVDPDEEPWLTTIKPREVQKPIAIFGEYSVVHYAFYTQRPALDTTNILDKYREIVFPSQPVQVQQVQEPVQQQVPEPVQQQVPEPVQQQVQEQVQQQVPEQVQQQVQEQVQQQPEPVQQQVQEQVQQQPEPVQQQVQEQVLEPVQQEQVPEPVQQEQVPEPVQQEQVPEQIQQQPEPVQQQVQEQVSEQVQQEQVQQQPEPVQQQVQEQVSEQVQQEQVQQQPEPVQEQQQPEPVQEQATPIPSVTSPTIVQEEVSVYNNSDHPLQKTLDDIKKMMHI